MKSILYLCLVLFLAGCSSIYKELNPTLESPTIVKENDPELSVPDWLLGDWGIYFTGTGRIYQYVLRVTKTGYQLGTVSSGEFEPMAPNDYKRYGYTEANTEFYINFSSYNSNGFWNLANYVSLIRATETIRRNSWSLNVAVQFYDSVPYDGIQFEVFSDELFIEVDETMMRGTLRSNTVDYWAGSASKKEYIVLKISPNILMPSPLSVDVLP